MPHILRILRHVLRIDWWPVEYLGVILLRNSVFSLRHVECTIVERLFVLWYRAYTSSLLRGKIVLNLTLSNLRWSSVSSILAVLKRKIRNFAC